MLSNNIASSAYGAAQRLSTGLGGGAVNNAAATAKSGGQSFEDLLDSGIDQLIGTQRKAEQLSKDMVVGKADINDVVLATQEADVVLTTATSLRDKFIAAYQDILRMAI